METEVRQLAEFSQFEELYHVHLAQDFSSRELRPLSSIQRLWEQGRYLCFCLYGDETLLAYACFYRRGSDYLFDYLAVVEEYRGRGLGSCFLRQLRDRIADASCVLCEIEDPDKAGSEEERAARLRRQAFYERLGFMVTEVSSRVFGIEYRVLEYPTGTEHGKAEIEALYTSFYRDLFLPRIFGCCFRITS